MIYQFEHEEIKMCVNCKLCDINFDWCNMQSCLIDKYKTPQENDCPLVVISKTETTSCDWCDGKEYTIDSRDYACLEITGNKLTAYGEGVATGYINYCPNCGRKLKGEL